MHTLPRRHTCVKTWGHSSSRAGPRSILFHLTSFHYNVDEEKYISIPDRGHYVEFARSPISAWAFSGYSGLLIRPKDVNVRWTGVPTLSQSDLSLVVCECALRWKGILSRVGSRLVPWVAGIGSSYHRPGTAMSRLKNNNLVFITFLNVYIAHIYFNA